MRDLYYIVGAAMAGAVSSYVVITGVELLLPSQTR